MFKLQR